MAGGADTGSVDLKSIEAGAQDWNVSCGVCHVGGGQMEYDRDRNPYSAASPSGDRYVYEFPNSQNGFVGRLVDVYTASPSYIGAMSDDNKAEVDCLLCHMSEIKPMMKYYISAGCSDSNPMGPNSDRNCSGVSGDFAGGLESANYGPTVDNFIPGTAYDMMNRNTAIKARNFKNAASAGLGATINTATGEIVAGTAPTSIANNSIVGTPSSAACAVCHARNEATIGVTSYGTSAGMKAGYGNYWQLTEPGQGYDIDDPIDHLNNNQWFEFGCKTGMGKRAHRTGVGINDKWGLSLMNLMFGFGKSLNDPVINETLRATNPMLIGSCVSGVCDGGMYYGEACSTNADCIPSASTRERIPDTDVHDASSQGMQCATCHYALGSKKSKPSSVLIGSGESQYETFTATTKHGVAYPAEDVWAIDHQFAQADSHKDTYGKNNLDDTVTCEGCHTTRTHPNLTDNGGTLVSPTPAHAGFPLVHLEKIHCTTCHIPEVYGAPARLKYRDWTTGYFKNLAFKNVLDWNYDMITYSHTPMPVLRGWGKVEEETGEATKIKPFLPSLMPIWVGNYGSVAGPLKSRDVGQAVRNYEDSHGGSGVGYDENGINVNHGNAYPLFDGFQLGDAWMIDTKVKVDAIANELNSLGITNPYIKTFVAPFDVTHGVVPKEWALGGSKRGGCISCHSSIDMFTRDAGGLPTGANPNYSPNSVGFFEGYQQPLNNAIGMGLPAGMVGIGRFDLAKNWVSIFADFDCTAMCIPSGVGNDEPMRMPMGIPNPSWNGAWDAFGAPVTTFSTFDGTKQCEISSMMEYFNSKGFFPGAPYTTVGMCTQFMNSAFDTVMRFPSGTAEMMGFHDGIAGLQGFVLEQGAPHECDPFSGTINMSPKNNFYGYNFASVNACLPDYATTVWMDGGTPGTWTGMIQGTCVANAGSPTGYSCSGGFKDGATCSPANPFGAAAGPDADCRGANQSGMFINGRDTARARSDIHIHQSVVGGVWRQSMPFSTAATALYGNPDNPSHLLNGSGWDQAKETGLKCGAYQNEYCCKNPATGMPAPCGDGMEVRTDIHANQLLGFTADRVAALQNLNNCAACHNATSTPSVNQGVNHHSGTCTTCHGTSSPVHQGVVLVMDPLSRDSVVAFCQECHVTPQTKMAGGTTRAIVPSGAGDNHHRGSSTSTARSVAGCLYCHGEAGGVAWGGASTEAEIDRVAASKASACSVCHSVVQSGTNQNHHAGDCLTCHTSAGAPFPGVTGAGMVAADPLSRDSVTSHCEACHINTQTRSADSSTIRAIVPNSSYGTDNHHRGSATSTSNSVAGCLYCHGDVGGVPFGKATTEVMEDQIPGSQSCSGSCHASSQASSGTHHTGEGLTPVSGTLCLACHTQAADSFKPGVNAIPPAWADCSACHAPVGGPNGPTAAPHHSSFTVPYGTTCEGCHTIAGQLPADSVCQGCHTTYSLSDMKHVYRPGTPPSCAFCHTDPGVSKLISVPALCNTCHAVGANPAAPDLTSAQLISAAAGEHGTSPVAEFGVVYSDTVSYSVFFASVSTCPTGDVCTYSWDFTSDGTDDATGTTATNVYAGAGSYLAKLTVNDTTRGKTSSVTHTVNPVAVAKPAPLAPTAAHTAAVISGLKVSFTDQSTDPSTNDPSGIRSVSINWGDGNTGPCNVAGVCSHTYAATGGTFSITQTATNMVGLSNSATPFSVTIAPPAASLYTVSGTVLNADGSVMSGASLALKVGATVQATTTSSSSGTYSFTGVANGSYNVAAFKSGQVFDPASRAVTVSGANVTGVNFQAVKTKFNLYITSSTPGALVKLMVGTTLKKYGYTDVNGDLTLTNVVAGAYTVVPIKSGVVFTPASAPVTIVNGTAAAPNPADQTVNFLP